MWRGIAPHGGFEPPLFLGGYEVVDGFNGIDVEDFVPVVAGSAITS